jgi:hypothetical protein
MHIGAKSYTRTLLFVMVHIRYNPKSLSVESFAALWYIHIWKYQTLVKKRVM